MPDALQKPKVPKLRFPEFKGDWKPSHAGDAFRNSRTKGEAGLPIYSVTMDRGLVPRDTLDRHLASDAEDGANLRAQKGDLVYNMMRMWQGAVGLADKECMVSPAYVVLAPKKGTSPEFFKFWFQSARMLYLLWAYSHGLTNDRLRLYFDDFAQIPIHLPTSEEQKKIAAFLSAVDAKLEALRRKRKALGRYKTGLTRQFFGKYLRFSSDSGAAFPDWEEKRFDEIVALQSTKFDPRNSKTKPILIELENIESRTGKIVDQTDLDAQLSTKNKFSNGDVLFGKLRPYLRKFALPKFHGVCSTEIWVFRPQQISSSFLFYLVQTDDFIRIANTSSGSKMPRAEWSTVSNAVFEIPHPDEQRKIADALATVDAKIQAVVGQISMTEAFKRSLLQKMFV